MYPARVLQDQLVRLGGRPNQRNSYRGVGEALPDRGGSTKTAAPGKVRRGKEKRGTASREENLNEPLFGKRHLIIHAYALVRLREGKGRRNRTISPPCLCGRLL
jgi:hypothetical protein